MMEMLFDEKVTVRRAASRTATNRTVYAEVLAADGGPLRLRCKIDRNARWVRNSDGVELAIDATMVYLEVEAPELRKEDLVVDEGGAAYRVVSFKRQSPLVFGSAYVSAGLAMTRLDVPGDEHGPQVH
jgi:hypothetical protein